MTKERDYAAEIDALRRSIARQRVFTSGLALTLAVIGLAGWTQKVGVMRATGLEIVDSKGQIRASIKASGTDTTFKLAGGGPPNGKGVIPAAEWWLGVNTNSLKMTDDTGSVNIQPFQISLSDRVPRLTLERLSLSSPSSQSGAQIRVHNGKKTSTFPSE